MREADHYEHMPELTGLLLAGGASRRMGQDKAMLDYHGRPALLTAFELLSRHCSRVLVSIARGQAPYPRLDADYIHDCPDARGPMAGILAAQQARPDSALLVLACDMPQMDDCTLSALLKARSPQRQATAYLSGGRSQPLCAIWEPASRPALLAGAARGDYSLSAVLDIMQVNWLSPHRPEALTNINSMEQFRQYLESE